MILKTFASGVVTGWPLSCPFASFRYSPAPLDPRTNTSNFTLWNYKCEKASQSLTIWQRRVRGENKWWSPFNVWHKARNCCSKCAHQNVSRDIVAQIAGWILLGESVEMYVSEQREVASCECTQFNQENIQFDAIAFLLDRA